MSTKDQETCQNEICTHDQILEKQSRKQSALVNQKGPILLHTTHDIMFLLKHCDVSVNVWKELAYKVVSLLFSTLLFQTSLQLIINCLRIKKTLLKEIYFKMILRARVCFLISFQ